jgi:cyclohexadieny/prephenate dehydrogenase
MHVDTLAIVGVGLIGASVGAAAKARGAARHVVGLDANPEHLRTAIENGSIDTATDTVARADLVIVCTPVDQIAGHVLAAARDAKPGTPITDVGSTKGKIVAAATHPFFVPAHPMAGSEKKGPAFARADLFDGRPVMLTPTERTDERAIARVAQFWESLGSRVVRVTALEHDRIVAAVSHLPHAIAACLAGCTNLADVPLSAGGWRDTTRVAGAGAGIWTPIFRENRAAILAALDDFTDHLAGFRRLLEADDGPGLTAWLADAKRVRDALGS